MKTATPIPLDQAVAVAEKLLLEKRRKGYQNHGAAASTIGATQAGTDTGYRVQRLKPVADGQTEQLLADPGVVMQVKYDGERRLLVVDTDGSVVGTNRHGLEVAINGDLASVVQHRLAVRGVTVIDGEDFGATFAPFDLLFLHGQDVRAMAYDDRLSLLEALMEGAPEFPRLETYRTVGQKRAAYERLRLEGEEGVVFKYARSPYSPDTGERSNIQYKDKFVNTCSCVVKAQNGNKRSVALELFDTDQQQWVGVGSCTIPVSFPLPQAGQIVETQYLYAYRAGALAQPVFKGVRNDVSAEDCTLGQLKYKGEAVSPGRGNTLAIA